MVPSSPSRRVQSTAGVALLIGVLLGAGCAKDAPPASQFASADTSPAGSDAALADSAGDTAGPIDSADTAATGPDGVAETADTAQAGPTCQVALDCLVAKKSWQPGQPPPDKLACTKGMAVDESEQMDAVTACVAQKCATELSAWDKGGQPELATLHLCMVGKCPVPLAICAGGHGDETCGDALKCLSGCGALEQACTAACLANTTENQAKKTGTFLECMFLTCKPEQVSTCSPPMQCVMSCPEVGG